MTRGNDMSFQGPLTAQEAVLEELRSWILTRRIKPGAPIRQDTIAADLGVSRVPVREALKILEGEGHVIYRRHRGYTLVDLDVEDLVEIYRIRRLLEDEAVRVGIPNLLEDDLDRMFEAIQDMERASSEGNIIELTSANRRFHFGLFEASALPRLQNFIRMLWDSSDPYRSMYFLDEKHRNTVNREHREIIEAVRARDVETALLLLDQHRENAVGELSKVISRGDA